MPHILLDAFDATKNVTHLSIHADIRFSKEYFSTPKAEQKMQEIKAMLEGIVKEFFNSYEVDQLQNHQYNLYANSK
jgi:hypothetical protein